MTRRSLSPDDRALWDRVRRSVRPIHHRRRRATGDLDEGTATAPAVMEAGEAQNTAEPPGGLRPRSAPAELPAPALPPLSPLTPRERRRLGRGAAEPDGRLDLHGMRQAAAFEELTAFLHSAQARGARMVLVITGKGRNVDEPGGILRQVVPRWLAEPQFRGLIVGFEPAGRRHGGEGAFYVRLRRRR